MPPSHWVMFMRAIYVYAWCGNSSISGFQYARKPPNMRLNLARMGAV